jgi:alkylation response protein AidB-like acyl-CoA dehydrogenase
MEFGWTPEQLAYRDATIRFGREKLRDDVIGRDKGGEFARELWRRCGEFGIQGMPFPPEYGGGGLDVLTTVLALESLGYACADNGLLFALAAQMWSVQMPIFRFGSEDQKQRFLPRLCSGEWVGAHGMSEPDSGSDAFSLRTTALRQGEEYVLNGTKTFVSEAPVADVFVTFATLDPARGALGLTGFIVERDRPGLSVGRHIEKMGLKTSPMAELVFENCRVPAANRLGREGRAVQIFNDSMEWERGCILAGAVGGMARLVEDAVKYARERRQFGQPITQFQSVANRLVEMQVQLETARLLLYRAAWAKEQNQDAGAAAALAKLVISESWVGSALAALRVRGGYGYTAEYEVERDLRDAVGGLLFSGTSDIQRNLLARSLGL